MSGHNSSRRRAYGRRQKDLRDRRESEMVIDLDGPAAWPRGGAWDPPSPASRTTDLRTHGTGGAA
jgi:hypothetical protein